MSKVFNSTFELSLRVLLTLSVNEISSLTVDQIATADFITVYSQIFGLSKQNLHGDNEFSFTEFALRRKQIGEAIQSLVLEALITVAQTAYGFQYGLSEKGKGYVEALQSAYAIEYRDYARKANAYMAKKTEKELLTLISKEASQSLKGD